MRTLYLPDFTIRVGGFFNYLFQKRILNLVLNFYWYELLPNIIAKLTEGFFLDGNEIEDILNFLFNFDNYLKLHCLYILVYKVIYSVI